MKKKTVKLFYSWQDDIDGKTNRSFIKNCLESALAEINKKSEIEDASRPHIQLDHDTMGVPGIPDIANTILYKISSADIFVADLTFVSEYQNHNGIVKKVSNQNVIFELGFAFNVLGPDKIICLFNEAFGQPKDLLFDLQHRRWPIMFNLPTPDFAVKKTQKQNLIQKLNIAIASIVNNPLSKKGKFGLHSPFSATQHGELEYLYNKLNIPIVISLNFREREKSRDWRNYNFDEEEKPWQQKNFSVRFLPALTSFIALGNPMYIEYRFTDYLCQMLENKVIFPSRENFQYNFNYEKQELELLLRTLGLVSSGEGKFLQKAYKLIHWLEFNGYKESGITVVEG